MLPWRCRQPERAKILKGRTLGIDGVGSVVASIVKVVAKDGGTDPASVGARHDPAAAGA